MCNWTLGPLNSLLWYVIRKRCSMLTWDFFKMPCWEKNPIDMRFSHVDMGKSHVNMGKSQHACSCPQQLDAPHVAPQMTPMPLAWVQREKEWRIMFATIHVFSCERYSWLQKSPSFLILNIPRGPWSSSQSDASVVLTHSVSDSACNPPSPRLL